MQAYSASVYNTLIKPNSILREIPILLGFNILLVATSYVSFYLPFSPVPVTGQTFGVLLIAMALGRLRGSAVVLAYLLEGTCGLPVFAGGQSGFVKLLGPTGGYLFGFLAATYIVGYLADLKWDRRYMSSILAMIVGMAIIYLFGLLWLSLFVPHDKLFMMGLYPFLPGAIIKIALAAIVLPSVWKVVKRKN